MPRRCIRIARMVRRGRSGIGSRFYQNIATVLCPRRSRDGRCKLAGNRARNLEVCFTGQYSDRADFVARNMSAAAQQWQNPARIGILAATYVHPKPDDVFEPGPMAILAIGLTSFC